MHEQIFKHYHAFYHMVLATTMMSNAPSALFARDATRITEFIGKAYRLPDDLIAECTRLILEDLSELGLSVDQSAVYNNRRLGQELTDTDALFDIKGDVLSTLQELCKTEHQNVNPSWFDYTHYKTYEPKVRFTKINMTGASGNLLATRQTGILKALGIGCTQDYQAAAVRLRQCVFWGDLPSVFFLSYVYQLSGDLKKSELFYQLAYISRRYLYAGYTVLPKEIADTTTDEIKMYYSIISSIKQDIVQAFGKPNIDFSFIEAITSPSLDYYQRMQYINNYDQKNWKELTNSSIPPHKKIGF